MKCSRCNGKGGFKQLTGFSEDDIAWDFCPQCNGTGKMSKEEEEKLKKILREENL
jgi:DnaJ-class molecular chaperone